MATWSWLTVVFEAVAVGGEEILSEDGSCCLSVWSPLFFLRRSSFLLKRATISVRFILY